MIIYECPDCGKVKRFGEWHKLDIPELRKLENLKRESDCQVVEEKCDTCRKK